MDDPVHMGYGCGCVHNGIQNTYTEVRCIEVMQFKLSSCGSQLRGKKWERGLNFDEEGMQRACCLLIHVGTILCSVCVQLRYNRK